MGKMKKPSRRIGRYEIIAKIAQGGMGAVYKAKHPTLNRFVLIKKLTLRGSAQFTERFKREARIMMGFKNERIVHVYDHFKEGSSYYIAEEFVDGLSLEQLISRERYLSNEAAALILYEVSKGLRYAHEQGVVHRDIKPGNILISNQGEVKLVDFGIATSREDSEEGLTRDGMTLGTPSYIPPEQIDNAKNVDRRADIYSLGVVVYEMLTGKTPFPGSFTAETIALIHKGRYTPPQRINPKVAPALRKIIAKAMKPNPRRRFQDLKQVIRRLERRIRRRDPATIKRALKRVVQGREVGDLYRRKRSWGFRLAVALILAGAVAAGGTYLYRRGYHYEFLYPGRYGALILQARVPVSYKDPQHVYLTAVLYREQGGELIRLEKLNPVFREDPEAGDERETVLRSRRLYLETGRYRVKVNLEGQLHWESLFLKARTEQRLELDTASGRQVEVVLQPPAAVPLRVRYSVQDLATGRDLRAETRLSVFLGGRWVRFTRTAAGRLKSGASYKFRFEHEGYYPQTYNLLVKPYQNLLELQADLIPIPGTLRIDSSSGGLELLLNESRNYLSGGRERAYHRLEPLTKETRELLLDPGEYLLTVKRNEQLSRSIPITVASEKTVRVTVSFDRSSRALEVAEVPGQP